MTEIRRTNGHGSGFADIIVNVNKPYHQKFIEAGWSVKSETNEIASFEYSCKNRYSGDDETVVQYLWNDLPEGVEGQFEVDWPKSIY